MAGCAIPASSTGHATGGAKTNHELTFNPDHQTGADQCPKDVTVCDLTGIGVQDTVIAIHVCDIARRDKRGLSLPT